ncbi:Nucleotide-binding universal stress protein, UspA family [Chitinophaga eiseniae]|uniref:Universal stress protein n=1 Tax=Chitinophaga eiseniae TaxID=634771 RepID=A0A1T4KEB6_9BACT|nr:universal stress protein [Chitinophaga eiseniae]SJZ40798.1 Nucleotide-binding universal stress protein, UspA family [Chitinophaga eiseniae]
MAEILIAVDLSPFSEQVISTGVELAEKMHAAVSLFTVIEIGIGLGLPEAGPVFTDDIQGRIKEAEDILQTYKNKYPAANVSIRVTTGNPKNETLDEAHNGQTAILVVGTHGRTGLNHMLVGSTAEYIIRHARIPVLVVPYNKEEH